VGSNGADGATWYSDTGAPGSELGALGDYYFRTDTGHVYNKTAGDAWTDIADLTGGRRDARVCAESHQVLRLSLWAQVLPFNLCRRGRTAYSTRIALNFSRNSIVSL
jgi:hypothetical protein